MLDKIILTDCDGVLLDWTNGMYKWLKEETGRFPDLQPRPKGVWFNEWTGLGYEEGEQLIDEFSQTSHFAQLEAFPDAVDIVNFLRNAGYQFVVVTNVHDRPSTYAYRWANLRKFFGDSIIRMHCNGLHTPKVDVLRQYPTTWYIDDHLGHMHEATDAGHRAIFLEREKTFSHFKRKVTDWHGVRDYITGKNDKSRKTS